MKFLLDLLRQAFGGLVSAVIRLVLSLALAALVIALMVWATLQFGLYGLLAVSVPVVLVLFVLGYIFGGSEGTSGD